MKSQTPMKKYWVGQRAPEMADAWFEFYKSVTQKGVLEKKTRELVAVACSVMARCEHCTEAHVQDALRAGASKEEISESIMMASYIASGSQLFWMQSKYEEMLGAEKE